MNLPPTRQRGLGDVGLLSLPLSLFLHSLSTMDLNEIFWVGEVQDIRLDYNS